MRRKPSASHCVKKLPLETYRPDNVVFSAGLQMLSSVNSNASGILLTDQTILIGTRRRACGRAVHGGADELQLLAEQFEGGRSARRPDYGAGAWCCGRRCVRGRDRIRARRCQSGKRAARNRRGG